MLALRWFVAVCFTLHLIAAEAALITSAGDIIGSTSIIDFSDHPVQEITLGPVQLAGGNVVFTATNSFEVAGFSSLLYGLGTNGQWGDGRTFAMVNPGEIATMRFTFAGTTVSAVGGFLNYCISSTDPDPGCGTAGVFVRALDAALNILEEYRLDDVAPISTPDLFNAGAFRGISRAAADIYALEISGASVLDDLTFSPAINSIPEPTTFTLLLLALAMVGWKRSLSVKGQKH